MSSAIKPISPSQQQITSIEAPINFNETSTSALSSHTNTNYLNSNSINNQVLNSSSIEIDSQFILRMPVIKQENGTLKLHKSTIELKELLEKVQDDNSKNEDRTEPSVDPLKDRLFIELNTETRKGRVKFDDEVFEARLVDLPCIIESLKTTDKKTFYKTGDICQMLICRTQDDPWSSSDEEKDQAKLNKLKKKFNQFYDPTNPALSHLRKYLWPHGITPPLKNVRRKRFRKIVRKKTVDYADIEKEVKHLFRADRDAVKIDYEVCFVNADSAEFLDDDDQVNDIMKSNDEYSSQDENTINKSLNDDQKSTRHHDQTSKQSQSSKNYDQNKKSTSFKSKEIIEESNLSSALDNEIFDESSIIKSNQNYDDNTTNHGYNDEDESNMSNLNSNNNNNNNRTSFKNLFVKQVIGDLSSSSDEDNKKDDEDEDEDLENKSKEIVKDDSESNLESAVIPKNSFNETNENNDYDEDIEEESNKKGEIEDLSVSLTSNHSSSSTSSLNKSSNKNGLKEKLNRLIDELHRIKADRKRREDEINAIPNPGLRKHLQTRLNTLIEEENKKVKEIEEIKSILNE